MGLKLTGIVAIMVMDKWARKFQEKLKENGVTLDLMKKYVDNINVILRAIATNKHWNKDNWKLVT